MRAEEASARIRHAEEAAHKARVEVEMGPQRAAAAAARRRRRREEEVSDPAEDARRRAKAEARAEANEAGGGWSDDDDEEEEDAAWAGWEEEEEGGEEEAPCGPASIGEGNSAVTTVVDESPNQHVDDGPAAWAWFLLGRPPLSSSHDGNTAAEEPRDERAGEHARRAETSLNGAPDGMVEDDRQAKAAERDEAIKLILARGRRTVRAALGLPASGGGGGGDASSCSDAHVRKVVLKTLRLLHPDYVINRPLKGTKRHARIEAAFKKLSSLKEVEGL